MRIVPTVCVPIFKKFLSFLWSPRIEVSLPVNRQVESTCPEYCLLQIIMSVSIQFFVLFNECNRGFANGSDTNWISTRILTHVIHKKKMLEYAKMRQFSNKRFGQYRAMCISFDLRGSYLLTGSQKRGKQQELNYRCWLDQQSSGRLALSNVKKASGAFIYPRYSKNSRLCISKHVKVNVHAFVIRSLPWFQNEHFSWG